MNTLQPKPQTMHEAPRTHTPMQTFSLPIDIPQPRNFKKI